MKKTSIGIVLAGMAMTGHAYAQSSVTLYGIVDVAVQFQNHVASSNGASGSSFSLISGGAQTSRWGMRVNEDLGGGYQAFAVLEDGFDATKGTLNNGGRLWGRTSVIGVKSPFGMLTLGRQVTLVYDFALTFDPVAPALYSTPVYDPAFAGRADNSSKYVGKTRLLGGELSVSALYSFGYDAVTGIGPVAGNYRIGKEESAFVTYRLKSAAFGFLFDQQNGNTLATQGFKMQRYGAGAELDLDPVKVFAGYRFLAQKQPTQNLYSSLYWLGLQYQITPALNVSSDLFYQEDRNTGQGNPASISILASYLLSKRTDIYVQAGTILNKAHSNLGFGGFGTATLGAVQTGATLGLRTRF